MMESITILCAQRMTIALGQLSQLLSSKIQATKVAATKSTHDGVGKVIHVESIALGCRDASKVEQALKEACGDVEAAIEILTAEKISKFLMMNSAIQQEILMWRDKDEFLKPKSLASCIFIRKDYDYEHTWLRTKAHYSGINGANLHLFSIFPLKKFLSYYEQPLKLLPILCLDVENCCCGALHDKPRFSDTLNVAMNRCSNANSCIEV